MWDRYVGALYERDLAARRIKHYTDAWVEAQKRVIELEEFFEGR
jgi:hypothetical protein